MDMEDDFEGTSTIVERKNENPIGFSGDSNKQNGMPASQKLNFTSSCRQYMLLKSK